MHVLLPGPRNEWPAEKIVLVTPAADIEAFTVHPVTGLRTEFASPWHRSRFPDENVPAVWFGDDCLPRTFAVEFTAGSAYVSHLLYLKMLELGLAVAGDGPDPKVDDRTARDPSDRYGNWVRPATPEEIGA